MSRSPGRWLWAALLTLNAVALLQSKEDPVQWTLVPLPGSTELRPGAEAWLEFKATVEPGWHLYSPTTPPGGPIITKIGLSENTAVTSFKLYRPQPVRKLDQNFGVDTETYTGEAKFLFEVTTASTAAGKTSLEAMARYQSCSDVKCLPPVKKTIKTDVWLLALSRRNC